MSAHANTMQQTLEAVRQTRREEQQMRSQLISTHFAQIVASTAAKRKAQPPPEPPRPPVRTPAQQLLDSMPKTTARIVGHHAIPPLPPPEKHAPIKPASELERLTRGWPRFESEELGHHPICAKDRAAELADVAQLMRAVKGCDLNKDPKLADAVAALRSRVAKLDSSRVRPSMDSRLCYGEDK